MSMSSSTSSTRMNAPMEYDTRIHTTKPNTNTSTKNSMPMLNNESMHNNNRKRELAGSSNDKEDGRKKVKIYNRKKRELPCSNTSNDKEDSGTSRSSREEIVVGASFSYEKTVKEEFRNKKKPKLYDEPASPRCPYEALSYESTMHSAPIQHKVNTNQSSCIPSTSSAPTSTSKLMHASPLENLLKLVHMKEYKEAAVKSIHYLVHKCPELVAAAPYEQCKDNSSILIRFLSFSLGNNKEEEGYESMLSIVALFLCIHPSLIGTPSLSTGNTPLHVALLYHGHCPPLMKLLVSSSLLCEKGGHMLGRKNRRNQLPLHLAVQTDHICKQTFAYILSTSCIQMPHVCFHRDWNGCTPISLAWNKLSVSASSSPENIVRSPQWSTIVSLLKAAHSHPNQNCTTWLLVHAAATAAHPQILQVALQLHPKQIYDPDPFRGKLPLHYCIKSYHHTSPSASNATCTEWQLSFDLLLDAYPQAARISDCDGRLPLHIALSQTHKQSPFQLHNLKRLLQLNPEAVSRKDPKSGLYPFMQAATYTTNLQPTPVEQQTPDDSSSAASLDLIFYLLSFAPELVLPS